MRESKIKTSYQLIKYPVRISRWVKNEKTVLVLGMGRSGTSMTTSVIQALGVTIGEKLLPPAERDNRLGYFEDSDFVSLNDNILTLAGGDYLNPPSRHKIILAGQKFDKKIDEILQSKTGPSLWGWKDPRTSLTAELYLHKLNNPFIIVCRRRYSEIASSLKRRGNEESMDTLISLSEEYNYRIDDMLNRMPFIPRLVLNYDNVLNNPKRTIRQLGLFLRIPYNKEVYAQALSNIRPEERHHTHCSTSQNADIAIKESLVPSRAVTIR